MKFTCSVQDLKEALAIVVKALNSNMKVGILEGILIETDSQRIRMRATDQAISINSECAANISAIGGTVVPGKLFHEMINSLPVSRLEEQEKDGETVAVAVPNELSFAADGGKVAVRCNRTRLNLSAWDADKFPQTPAPNEKTEIELPAARVRELIQRTSFSISGDEARPVLTGALLEIEGGVMRMVALDGFRLAMHETRLDADTGKPVKVIIPKKALDELSRVLAQEDADVGVVLDSKYAAFTVGESHIVTRLLEGEFMNFRQIIPSSSVTYATADKKTLQEVIQRAAVVSRHSQNNLISFSFDEDGLTVTSNAEQNDIEETMNLNVFSGKPLKIAFNVQYIIEVLRVIDSQTVDLSFQSSFNPCLITPGDGSGSKFIVLPVRVYQ
ncbi:MAG: DNA polymerase III subunit beta [Oscillospiraceae bacterium]|jgi:DNA polymerase-3 subunit beta|nr:DNA polymerase III subunit beta [Oscillospiraceae bacterium]